MNTLLCNTLGLADRRFRGGGVFWAFGGGEGNCADFIFMGARIFLNAS